MEPFEHLLSKHGILTSFRIARKLDEESIKDFTEKIQSKCKTKAEFNEKLRQEIEKKTNEDITKNKIPGLISKFSKIQKDQPVSSS